MLIYENGDSNIENMLLFLFSAIFCLVIGWLIMKYRRNTCEESVLRDEKTQKEKTVFIQRKVNTKTGEEIIFVVKDTFFGLPIMIWSIIFVILGVIYYFVG